MTFRFEDFADASAARAAFEAAFPPGSPAEQALQALVDAGASCRTVGAAAFACRYVEPQTVTAGFCWHVGLEADAEKRVRRVVIGLALTGA
jgi:hypothetical protein